MPIYEYICLECKKEYEMLRSFSEADQAMQCDACGSANVKRKLSLVFAQNGGHADSAASASSCGSCSGGNCASCGH